MATRGANPDKISLEQRFILAGLAYGTTTDHTAASLDWSMSKVMRVRRNLLKVHGEGNLLYLTLKLIGSDKFDMLSVLGEGKPGSYFGKDVADQVIITRQALTAEPLSSEQIQYLVDQLVAYPQNERAWSVPMPSREIRELLHQARISEPRVAGAYALIMCLATQLGQVDWKNVLRPTAVTDPEHRLDLPGGVRVTIQAPPGTKVYGSLNGRVITWTA